MAISPNSSSLELTISIPSFSPSPSSPGGDHHGMRDFDINQTPKTEADHMIGATQHANEEDSNSGGRRRKKLRLTKEQSHLLEESFIQNHTLTPVKAKKDLATFLKLSQRQVEVWFQNRRARSKLKHTEMECEYLKRWFGSLKEQNRRLQIEVEELRALKPSSTTALTMCPRCERVSEAADNDSNAVQEGAAVSSSRSRMTISSSSSLC